MNKKNYLLVILFLGVSLFISNIKAQPQISFIEKKYDFGTVQEKGGLISHVFHFTNTGNSALLINRVRTSCGCTTPDWTKTPIEPGMKGSVKVTYNPNGRPYPFNKPITVYSNALQEIVTLRIKGKVVKTSNIEKKYPFSIGNLRLKSKNFNFNATNKGEKKSKSIEIINNSTSKMTVSVIAIEGSPIGFSVEVPTVLQPQQKGNIQVTFDSKKTDEWGTIISDVFLKINGIEYKQPKNKISLNANVVEDFSKMTKKQKQNAPIAQTTSSHLDLGKIKQGKKVKGKIYIENVGKNLLKIRKVTNNHSNITIQAKTRSAKTGKNVKFIVYVDTKGLPKGSYKKTFQVLTNDPINTIFVYTINYQVI